MFGPNRTGSALQSVIVEAQGAVLVGIGPVVRHEAFAGNQLGDSVAIDVGQDQGVGLRPGVVDDVLFPGDLRSVADLLVPEDAVTVGGTANDVVQAVAVDVIDPDLGGVLDLAVLAAEGQGMLDPLALADVGRRLVPAPGRMMSGRPSPLMSPTPTPQGNFFSETTWRRNPGFPSASLPTSYQTVSSTAGKMAAGFALALEVPDIGQLEAAADFDRLSAHSPPWGRGCGTTSTSSRTTSRRQCPAAVAVHVDGDIGEVPIVAFALLVDRAFQLADLHRLPVRRQVEVGAGRDVGLPSLLKSATQQASLRNVPMRCMTNLISSAPAALPAGGSACVIRRPSQPTLHLIQQSSIDASSIPFRAWRHVGQAFQPDVVRLESLTYTESMAGLYVPQSRL